MTTETKVEGAEQAPSNTIPKKEIDAARLAGLKVWIATPMYGGNANGDYMNSVMRAMGYLSHIGVQVHFDALFNESLITRARNYMVDKFLRSDFDFILFIDSDLSFDFNVPATLLAVHVEDPEKKIITATYPKKDIAWEKVQQAVLAGVPKEELSRYVGDFVLNLLPPPMNNVNPREPFQVAEAGTGMMLIHRSVFNDIRLNRPDLLFRPDHIRDKDFDGSRLLMAYFDTMIDPETRRYLSEDYMFCRTARECGHPTWMCAWLNLTHIGTYHFHGDLLRVIGIGAHLTYDKNHDKKEET